MNDAGVDLGNDGDEMGLTARFFERGDLHVVLDLEDGKRQVFEDMDPEGMRQLAYNLEDVLAVDEDEFEPDDPYDDVVADADSDKHGFYVAKNGVGDIRIRPPDAAEDDYLEMSAEQALEFSEALLNIADSYEEHFDEIVDGSEDAKAVKHPGHPDQSVHGRRRKPPSIDIPAVSLPQPEPEQAPTRKPPARPKPPKPKPPKPASAARLPVYVPPKSLTAAERARATKLIEADPNITATVHERHGRISWSGMLSDDDAAWLQSVHDREPAFVNRLAQTARINRRIGDAAKKAGQTPAVYKKDVAARLGELLDGKPVAVRVRDETALRGILSGGRFKTSLEGAKRAPHLSTDADARRLGEQILGISPETPPELRPVYGYVAIHGIEPALSEGKKISGIAQREGQEDVLSVYGKVQVVLKPEVRGRSTATVGDSLDEIGWIRPSPLDSPSAESVVAHDLEWMDDPGWTRTGYVEAQVHGGVRTEDIAEVVFPADPQPLTAAALDDAGIAWRVLKPNGSKAVKRTYVRDSQGQFAETPGGDAASDAWASLRDRQQRVEASSSSPVRESRRNGGFMGGTAREVHADGTTTIHKQLEDDRDSDALTGVRQADAEELGSLVANAVGLRAPAVHRVGPTDLHMELMDGKHIEHSSMSPWQRPPQELAESDQGVLLGLLDIVIGNPDRHAGNYLVGDDGAIIPLDHALSFGKHGSAGLGGGFSGPFMNDARNDWPEKIDISPEDMDLIRERLDGIKGDFERLGRTDWWDQMIENLDTIAERASGTRRRVA
ncbi:hypothetical protein [Rhizocola hellebori]|uniref:hypothetical protein n=1 Tax=Rhizocola hellebori TaxID=1392758 RepID=UPI0019417D80|nr:hypothetical protein [Rhizocola hellebori]